MNPVTSAPLPPPNNLPLKIGMVGVGGFGKYRRERLRETGLFQMAACYDHHPEVLEQAAREEGAQSVPSLDALLATPGLEGLVISTGIDTHAPLAIRAMEAGLHVFVEKPLCGTTLEIEQLRAAQAATGKVFALGHSDNLTNPICRLVKQQIAAGTLGTLVSYEENSSHSGGLEIKPGDWRGRPERNPGGMLMQCGVHSLHHLIHLFGPISELNAMMRFDAHTDTQTADAANVLLRHDSGLVGTLNCYHVTAYFHEFRLFGTKGNLYIDTQTKRAWYQPRKRNELEERVELEVPKETPESTCSNLVNWHRAIREGSAPNPSLEDGIQAVLPVFAAERANNEKRTVSMKEFAV